MIRPRPLPRRSVDPLAEEALTLLRRFGSRPFATCSALHERIDRSLSHVAAEDAFLWIQKSSGNDSFDPSLRNLMAFRSICIMDMARPKLGE